MKDIFKSPRSRAGLSAAVAAVGVLSLVGCEGGHDNHDHRRKPTELASTPLAPIVPVQTAPSELAQDVRPVLEVPSGCTEGQELPISGKEFWFDDAVLVEVVARYGRNGDQEKVLDNQILPVEGGSFVTSWQCDPLNPANPLGIDLGNPQYPVWVSGVDVESGLPMWPIARDEFIA